MPSTSAITAIIGAGIAGLACAQTLHDAGRPVALFDKGRGPGGRMSSRHLPGAIVDLGAQFFSVRDNAFRQQVDEWQRAGCVAPWPQSLWQVDEAGWQPHHDDLERFTGTPRMSSIAPHDATLAEACEAAIQRPCWAAWARFEAPLPTLPGVADDWQAVRLPPGPLRFVSRNDHKPGPIAGAMLSPTSSPKVRPSIATIGCHPRAWRWLARPASRGCLALGTPSRQGAARYRSTTPSLKAPSTLDVVHRHSVVQNHAQNSSHLDPAGYTTTRGTAAHE